MTLCDVTDVANVILTSDEGIGPTTLVEIKPACSRKESRFPKRFGGINPPSSACHGFPLAPRNLMAQNPGRGTNN